MPIITEVLTAYGKGDTFIETGTHKGEGVICALESGFDKIYSIEILENSIKYAKSLPRINESVKTGQVQIIQGSSDEVLSEILPDIPEPVTFWLDAHSDELSVIHEELEAIKLHRKGGDTLLIDDIQVMDTDYKWASTVNKDSVLDLVDEVNPYYHISYVDGKREKDILVASI